MRFTAECKGRLKTRMSSVDRRRYKISKVELIVYWGKFALVTFWYIFKYGNDVDLICYFLFVLFYHSVHQMFVYITELRLCLACGFMSTFHESWIYYQLNVDLFRSNHANLQSIHWVSCLLGSPRSTNKFASIQQLNQNKQNCLSRGQQNECPLGNLCSL